MLQLIGRPAFSAFRLEKLLNSIQAEVPAVTAVRTEFRYFVEIEGECVLPAAEHQVIETLLEAEMRDSDAKENETFFLVTPRPGTTSPWSSKATDIAVNSGVKDIERVERGVAFFIEANETLTQHQKSIVRSLLHDRMIETVFETVDETDRHLSK